MPKTSTKNGTPSADLSAGPAAAPDAMTEVAGIVISSDERAQLATLEADALRFKIALADADLQLARFESARAEIRQKAVDASKAYVDAVVAAAGAHGIDLNDKTARWNFDTSKMTFTRQG